MKQTILSVVTAVSLAMCFGNAATCEDAPSIVQLPAPTKTGGMPLADALAARRSTRTFADVELPPQQLSDLLWATAGVNREDGRTTYPVAMGRKDMTLFVFMKSGAYRYDPDEHALVAVASGDRRADAGVQPFVGQAAVNFVFVQDMALWDDSDEFRAQGEVWGYAHAGVAGFGFRFGARVGDDAYELTERQVQNLRAYCEKKYKEFSEERAQQSVKVVQLAQLPPEIVAAMNSGMPGAAGAVN